MPHHRRSRGRHSGSGEPPGAASPATAAARIRTTAASPQCFLWNGRERIGRVTAACEELVKHGRMKPEAERGLDEMAEREGKRVEKGPYYAADPLGVR